MHLPVFAVQGVSGVKTYTPTPPLYNKELQFSWLKKKSNIKDTYILYIPNAFIYNRQISFFQSLSAAVFNHNSCCSLMFVVIIECLLNVF